ncbi:MAG TPA: hypothetical protein VK543_13980 [Puia sp.]|nr:hypothetical protein [Puia sp.]
MNRITQFMICLLFCLGTIHQACAQKKDTAKVVKENALQPYFIITAGPEITAFFNDKPVAVSTVEDFNNYVQANIKSLRDSRVVVTGKPKSGTFDEVIKTLKRNRFKNISQHILTE